jgi:hypothetical protein
MPGIRKRQARWLTVALTVAAIGLAACSGDDEDDGGTTPVPDVTTSDPEADSQSPALEPVHGGEPILIKTRVKMFAGKVLAGSVIGESPFCPGGTVRHEHGSPEIGFPAVNVFRCPDGQLEIGFGPGPDQMNNTVQTSGWEVLDGSGRFAGISGEGQMIVQWPRVGSSMGQETFTGTITREPDAS